MKTVAKWLMLLLTLSFLTVPAFAADANVTYTGNAGSFIFSPGSAYSLTDLFTNFKDVMPGETRTEIITVRNDADNRVKVKIYMRSLGATDERYVDFLNQLRLGVRQKEENPMFDAAADELDGLADWVCLGTLYSGGETDLEVALQVPTSLDNLFQKQYGEIEWQFMVEELPVSPDDPKPPKTGDNAVLWPWVLALTGTGAGIMLMIRERKGRTEKRGAGE